MSFPSSRKMCSAMIWDKHLGQLGKGTSGTVSVYRKRDGSVYALKVYQSKEKHESNNDYKDRTINEYTILHEVSHINIVQVFSFSQATLSNKTHLRLEYCGRKTLQGILNDNELKGSETLCFWKQICMAVEYLHSLGICHRDLKFANVLLHKNGHIKLIDFMDARRNETCHGIIGTSSFVAPEVFNSLSYNGAKIDTWSLGIMLYYILHKRFPWRFAKHDDKRFKQYLLGKNQFQVPQQIRGNLNRLLDTDPETRSSSSELRKSSWFNGLPFCDDKRSCGWDHRRLYVE